jgi:hypothetical protein
VIAEDVAINSPTGYGVSGLQVLKHWARNFTDLGYRIDLVDEHLALDDDGNAADSSRSACIGSTLRTFWAWPRPAAKGRRSSR